MWRNILMPACPLLCWMVTEEARRRILNSHLHDHCYCRVACWDHHRDPYRGYIICFSRCRKKEEEDEKCSPCLSWFKIVASDKYEKIKGMTKGNVNEGIVNEYKRWVKERKHSYDLKHRRDVSFYPVDNSRILACPATYTFNSLDGRELEIRMAGEKHATGLLIGFLWWKSLLQRAKKRFMFH